MNLNWLLLVGCLLCVVGCGQPTTIPPTPAPLVTHLPATPTRALERTDADVRSITPFPLPSPTTVLAPTLTPISADTGWQSVAAGLERRTQALYQDTVPIGAVEMVRIDPAYYRFAVEYRPTRLVPLKTWQAETGAAVLINGGFFDENYRATGLTIADETVHGVSYTFGGMVTVDADGQLKVRALAAEPYYPSETWHSALQAFPMLVYQDGQRAFVPEDDPNPRIAARTVIGQDRSGRILLIVSATPYFTLADLSDYLARSESDLDLAIALNLDGGPSSGMIIAEPYTEIGGIAAVPITIAVYKR